MKPNPCRVASLYRQALVVPFRRDREYSEYRVFLKRLQANLAIVEDAELDLQYFYDEVFRNVPDASPYWHSRSFIQDFESELGARKDVPINDRPDSYYQEQYYVREGIRHLLERTLPSLRGWSEWVQAAKDELSHADFTGIDPATVARVQKAVAAAKAIPEALVMLLKRIKRTRENESERIPASAEVTERETLYHASVNAKGLKAHGFSSAMPEEGSSAGLGGSQSTAGSGKGISFTEDEYVAKEIARVLKEVTMVAHGAIKHTQILDWIRRDGQPHRTMEYFRDNFMRWSGLMSKPQIDPKSPFQFGRLVMDEAYLEEVKAGRAEYDPRRTYVTQPIPPSELYGSPESVMGLYLSYLNFSGRYDPKFFGVGGPAGLVRMFQGLDVSNIGYVKATVDMTHPDIIYLRGEREFRVPPEAVVSVDAFI